MLQFGAGAAIGRVFSAGGVVAGQVTPTWRLLLKYRTESGTSVKPLCTVVEFVYPVNRESIVK